MQVTRIGMLIASAAALMLAGCGGGSSNDSAAAPAAVTPPPVVVAPPPPIMPAAPTTVGGTAAVGAPIIGTVVAIDINGKLSPPASTSALGAYTVNVAGMTAPFILSVTGTAGGNLVTLNSIATAAGQTANITPLTDLIVSTASGQPAGSSLAALCAPVSGVVAASCTAALTEAAKPAKLDAAVTAVTAMIAPINTDKTNPLTGSFVANGKGMDAVLDQILVQPAEAQGAQATVTLIATSAPLGTVTLPPAAGGNATIPAATPPSTEQLAVASATANVLPEIKACMAALSSLYPETGFTVPTAAKVTPFIDDSFNFGQSFGKTEFIAALTNADNLAHPGLGVVVAGFSTVDMSPLTSAEVATLTSSTSTSTTRVADFIGARASSGANAITLSNGAPSSAWVRLQILGQTGVLNVKMVKTTDTSGCAGGWKVAGTFHADMHMNARVSRFIDTGGAKTYRRELALHVETGTLQDQGFSANTRADVRGPGLTTLGDFKAGTSTPRKVRLLPPNSGNVALRVADYDSNFNILTTTSTYYGDAEAIQSCQELNAITTNAPPAGTVCFDESKLAPGKIFVWTLIDGTSVTGFPFQINAVPLSRAFTIANENDLFVKLNSITPASLLGLPADSPLDGVVTFNYTQPTAYGSRMDNCRFVLKNGTTTVLNVETNAVGKETACTFTVNNLNSIFSNVLTTTPPILFRFRFTGPINNGTIGLSSSVLGNQVGTAQPAI